MAREANKPLFELLDECTFQPLFRLQEKDLPENKRYQLSGLKDFMQQQRSLFHNCVSDEEVYQAYHEQLEAEETDKVNHQLRDLDLPALADCREQFERAASTLFDQGVRKDSRLP